MTHTFPDDFFWGTSTAAHQIEGNNLNSDWWRLEQLGAAQGVQPSGDALDGYHRYEEDMQLLADAGFNAYRFSVEWALIEPLPGCLLDVKLELSRGHFLAGMLSPERLHGLLKSPVAQELPQLGQLGQGRRCPAAAGRHASSPRPPTAPRPRGRPAAEPSAMPVPCPLPCLCVPSVGDRC